MTYGLAEGEIDVLVRDAKLAGEAAKIGRVGREQHQRAEARRTDRIALGHRLGRVADRVERVGAGAHVVVEARHFGDAAGIVGDRAIGVERDDHAGEREHRGRREGDADQARELVRDDDADADDERRKRRRFKADGEALDDVGAVAGLRGLGDALAPGDSWCRCNIR